MLVVAAVAVIFPVGIGVAVLLSALFGHALGEVQGTERYVVLALSVLCMLLAFIAVMRLAYKSKPRK